MCDATTNHTSQLPSTSIPQPTNSSITRSVHSLHPSTMAPIISAAAANQPAFLYAFLIPVGLGLVPLLVLFVRVVRRRRSASASASCTAEDRRFPAWYEKGPRWIAATMEGPSTEDEEHSDYDDDDEAPRQWSSPRRKASSGGADSWDALTEAELEVRRAAHLKHIRNNVSPFTARTRCTNEAHHVFCGVVVVLGP
ncbi:hypothetical protein DFH08DRAFT_832541 [Mycena albidolilacea]|uniref:Uncharacterized protein n=1 Tax=Mycena albidolilacea TaxID=1033008 RepID=A0AAD7AVP2_9AGAR|nr:hypothetical protein DFH08DRAFT_832541 [Mycena albidolilacea]